MTRTFAVAIVVGLSACGAPPRAEDRPAQARSALEESGYVPTKDELAKALEVMSTERELMEEVGTPEGQQALSDAIAHLNDSDIPCTGQCTCLAQYLICVLRGGNSYSCIIKRAHCVKQDIIENFPR